MSLEFDLKESREHEMRVYLDSMKAMYENALLQNGEIYDIAADLTDDFTRITPEAILEDSRIIKILRYAIAPSISQMKFGQFFGLSSLDKYEKDKLNPRTAIHNSLKNIAPKIADFTSKQLDRTRFIWMEENVSDYERNLATDYAKKWTCSIASDQNAQTKYRNWRKDQQEHAIASAIVELGYTRSSFTGIISKNTDINLGEYTQEIRVQGRTRQKADLAVRSKKSHKLVLIEAKVVGVEIDSNKRIKECCDKANDWRSSVSLDNPIVVATIAGFFNPTGIQNIQASKIRVIWEHRLTDLKEIL
jgi:hypothetical protein